MTTRPLLAVLAIAATACSPSLLPGTEVKDTRENRAVYEVIRLYAEAMQKRDAPAILALVADDYFDGAGTIDPSDDLDRAGLEKALATDLARVDSVRLELAVKTIEVRNATAQAELIYDSYFRVTTPAGPVPRRESDLHLMKFKKVGEAWKITSGL